MKALVLFASWFGLVLFLSCNHVVSRDEVRALSLALQGENVFAMLKGIHEEGHPAVWYLLLRGVHDLVARPEILQGVALIVTFASILLLMLRSPFSLPLITLILIGPFAIFEYSVMARNYGISMLLLFLLATFYERHRDRGFLIGALLFLLANCNAHSVLLVGAFLLFWLLDIAADGSVRRPQVLRTFLLNSAIAAFGVAICLLTMYPPNRDVMIDLAGGMLFKATLKAVFLPTESFTDLMLPFSRAALKNLSPWMASYVRLLKGALFSLLIFGSMLGLVRRPGAFVAALVALISFSLFFNLVYGGAYRHEALWLVFLISMYWIIGSRDIQRDPVLPARLKPHIRPVSTIGSMLFLLFVALQVPEGIYAAARAARNDPPFSRSRDLAALVTERRDLQDAIIIADPDVFVEPLSYYIPNRTYLMREQRFGNVVRFTRKNVRLRLTLDEILASARSLRLTTGKPVMILLEQRLDPSLPPRIYKEDYWELVTTPEQVRAFQAWTRFIKRFGPALTNESFDVYMLD